MCMAFPMSREYEKGTFKHKMAEAANLPKDLALGLADKVWADPLYRETSAN